MSDLYQGSTSCIFEESHVGMLSDSQDSFRASASSSPIFSESTRSEEAEDDNVTLLDNLPLSSHQEKEMWHKELTDLFPLHSQQAIERSLIGAASMDKAANKLIEVSTAGEEPKTVSKVKTNASLVSLLQSSETPIPKKVSRKLPLTEMQYGQIH